MSVCAPIECTSSPCEAGFEAKEVKPANATSGQCCPVVDCVRIELVCEEVKKPECKADQELKKIGGPYECPTYVCGRAMSYDAKWDVFL